MRDRTDGVSMHAGIIGPVLYMINNLYSILLITIGSIFRRKK